jgi:hypothetical protein
MEGRHGQDGCPHPELKRVIDAMRCGAIIGMDWGIILNILYNIILYIHM